MSHPDRPLVARPPDAFLDGCELDFTVDPTSDDDIDGLLLFADIDPSDTAAVVAREREWLELGALTQDGD